ncbi:HNH endonuclease [Paenibacillus sp. PDC88]|uniref:HNH endonuclease n=1 Tax=Paenibacillus sp. PDC88 TaxID=1884375 RepID=UPI00089D0BB4|nr:HNH endonuclease signature motif containing protein [Paenibacillus sp. PDC88]SDW23040.1 HNH endonuclease [Paenibacillus sp. PDC88]
MTEEKLELLTKRLAKQKDLSCDERIQTVSALISQYIESSGQTPDSRVLEKAADYILYDDLSDSNPHKVFHTEYPILSKSQVKFRFSSELPLHQVEDELRLSDTTLYRYANPREDLALKIRREVNHYSDLNSKQPVISYKLEADELAYYRELPMPKFIGFRGRDHAEWSLDVRRRDSFTCQQCGKQKRVGLHAHHIESYDTAIDLRYDIDNGITLCKRCHSEFHSIYGYGGNNRRQLNEWMRGEMIID